MYARYCIFVYFKLILLDTLLLQILHFINSLILFKMTIMFNNDIYIYIYIYIYIIWI